MRRSRVSGATKRLNVMAHRAEIDGRYGELDHPSNYVDPHRDVVKEVEDKFGESSVTLAAGMRGRFRERTHENPAGLPGKGRAGKKP